jgi:hypothetical protein
MVQRIASIAGIPRHISRHSLPRHGVHFLTPTSLVCDSRPHLAQPFGSAV